MSVAQIFNLLYRRIVFCQGSAIREIGFVRPLAECNSAIQQSATLRYEKESRTWLSALLDFAGSFHNAVAGRL